jgi:uncharacterized protein (TIGR02466 family)
MEVLPTFSKIICSTELNLSEKDFITIEDYLWKLELFHTDEHVAVATDDKFVLRHPTLKFLHDRIMGEFYRLNDEHLKYENKFVMNTSWYTHSKPGQSAPFHNHSNCMFSGVFYVKVPENSGDIEFDSHSGNTFQPRSSEPNIFNSRSIKIKPSKGKLLFFDSNIYHEIKRNESDEIRVSIAFNLLPVGDLGYFDSHLKLNFDDSGFSI